MLFQNLNRKLRGSPDSMLTALLMLVAAIAVLTAIYAQPATKAAVAAWFIFP